MRANEKLAPQRAYPVDDRFYSCARGFSHPLIRENVDDFIQDSYRGGASFGDDADTSIRPGSHSGAGPVRVVPSNADVLNGGAPTPEASLASAPPEVSEAYATMESGNATTFWAQRYRSYDPESGTFLGYDGRRHRCG